MHEEANENISNDFYLMQTPLATSGPITRRGKDRCQRPTRQSLGGV